MGWCDDPRSLFYNKLIKLPSKYSHEKLYRNDNLYDLIVVLSYNTNPIIKNKGSAIFMHIAKASYTRTKGCISLKKEHQVTKFYNPLIIAQYASTISDVKKLVANDISNSNYFHHWNLEVEEDDFILFPSYLKHEVTETPKTENLRVTLSTNIIIRGAGI